VALRLCGHLLARKPASAVKGKNAKIYSTRVFATMSPKITEIRKESWTPAKEVNTPYDQKHLKTTNLHRWK
jgi:hypothetical protein